MTWKNRIIGEGDEAPDRTFKGNRLRLRPGVVIPEGGDSFGMVLVDKTKDAQP